MRSDKQHKASKRNGAKSNGPVTPEGKVRSARNAETHNLTNGHLVLLSTEDPGEFEELRDQYLHRFQPIDGVEFDLVHKLIAATWREKRVTGMETSLFEIEMLRQQADVDEEYSHINAAGRQTMTLFGVEDTKAVAALLFRYGATARRSFSAAFRTLRELQGDRFNQPPAVVAPMLDRAASEPSTPAVADPSPAPLARPRPQPSAIVLRHSLRMAPRTAAENTKLQNEPERAIGAGAFAAALHDLISR